MKNCCENCKYSPEQSGVSGAVASVLWQSSNSEEKQLIAPPSLRELSHLKGREWQRPEGKKRRAIGLQRRKDERRATGRSPSSPHRCRYSVLSPLFVGFSSSPLQPCGSPGGWSGRLRELFPFLRALGMHGVLHSCHYMYLIYSEWSLHLLLRHKSVEAGDLLPLPVPQQAVLLSCTFLCQL